MSEQLPDDVIELLRSLRMHDGSVEEQAAALLDKYGPKPKSLADHGDIYWTRFFTAQDGHPNTAECIHPLGAYLNGARQPWPEIEGIDPAELLNGGWQIRPIDSVPDGWMIGTVHSGDVVSAPPWLPIERVSPATQGFHSMLVFCPPPLDVS